MLVKNAYFSQQYERGISMIYTVTFNPSLDYVITVDDFVSGATNRCTNEHILTGGKGVNVSIVLKNLGVDSTALGFIAGFTGNEIERSLGDFGLNCDFIKLKDGLSRINVKMKGRAESEINSCGPYISTNDVENLMQKISKLEHGDYLVLAGSIPNSVPDTIYMEIMKSLKDKQVNIVVDATGDLLLNVLEYKPFLVKPNNFELEDIFGVKCGKDKNLIAKYAKKLQEKGARNVLVSMAGDGAVLFTENGDVHFADSPNGVVKNSVGAGDSMVAGFLVGWLKEHNYREAFKWGIAAGSASAFSDNLATKAEVKYIYGKV